MAAKGRENVKSSSLLLQPPKSGFSWDPAGSSAFLMPVTQNEATVIPEDSGEVDSFVNQAPPATDFQHSGPPASSQQILPDSPFMNQLQQPLRPVQSTSPQPSVNTTPDQPVVTGGSQSSSPFLHPVNTTEVSSIPPTQYFSPQGPPTTGHPLTKGQPPTIPCDGPPSKGPPQNFRHKGPRVYAPPPGITSIPTAPVDQPSVFPDHQTIAGHSSPPAASPSTFQPQPQNYGMYSPSTSQIPSPPPPESSPYYSGMQGSQYVQYQRPPQPNLDNIYKPVQPHWFYVKVIEKNEIWLPFSMFDSVSLEEAYRTDPENAVIATDGGRYDVYLGQRIRKAVYWEEEPSTVRRCTWFYRAEGQNRYIPYEEDFASILEEHYKSSILNNSWHQRLELPNSEVVVMHNSNVVLHFMASSHPDEWGNVAEGQTRPRSLKRGIGEFANIEDGEPTRIDHLVFVIHGIGAVCDMRFRTVVECVDDIRSMALGLLHSHFKPYVDEGKVGRVEFLPVSWHSMLHSEATGIDRRLRHITLSSIPKLRHFINDTILDIPFYCSSVYCQTIISAVGSELNRLYSLFLSRNPRFSGNISVVGHSLGSLILFDILAHQQQQGSDLAQEKVTMQLQTESSPQHSQSSERSTPDKAIEEDNSEATLISLLEKLGLQEYVHKFQEEKIDLETLKMCTEDDIKELGLPKGPRLKLMTALKELSQKEEMKPEVSACSQSPESGIAPLPSSIPFKLHGSVSTVYTMGVEGSGQALDFPVLKFRPSIFFALGSPVAMFLTVRGVDTVGEDYRLPTCPYFYNIFHPFDPVAYRMETLIDPTLNVKPVLVPHHKGRKRMHLEIRESLSRLGADLKQKILEPIYNTWNTINDFARAHRPVSDVQDLPGNQQDCDDTESTVSEVNVDDVQIGQLNGGQRIDYVLQEKPLESLNEYLFALGSHASYWESEDTVLMIIKKIYALLGIFPVHQGPPAPRQVPLYNPALAHSSQFSDISPLAMSASSSAGQLPQVGISPTQPPPTEPVTSTPHSFPVQSQSQAIGPPPLTGFVKTSPLVRR